MTPTETGQGAGIPDNSARRAAVAAFVHALRQRLDRPASAAAPPEHPEAIARQVEPGEDLVERFTRAASAVGIEVHSTTPAAWFGRIVDLLQALEARAVVVPAAGDGFFTADRVEQLVRELGSRGVTPTHQTDDETLFSVDAAITGVVTAIAEHGTLVGESGAAVARGASLIPPVHIAVVDTSQLLADLHDYFAGLARRPDLPANINLISGPSKTADIEGVLVTGVHGPGSVHVVLVAEQ